MYELLRRLFHIGNFCFLVPFLKQLLLRNFAVDFVEICNVYIGKMVITAAKRIFNSDKICRSYSDLNFGVTFLEHSVLIIKQIAYLWRDEQRDWLGRAFPHAYPAIQSCDTQSVGSVLEGNAGRPFCPSRQIHHLERET